MAMFRCPRCNNELAANARFCNKCGFTPTGMPAPPVGGATPPNAMKPTGPGAGPVLPPIQRGQAPMGQPVRGPQPQQPAPRPTGQPPQQPVRPASGSAGPALPPLRPAPVSQSNNPAMATPSLAGGMQPVRTSTPPPSQGRPGGTTPAPSRPGQTPASALPPLTPQNVVSTPGTPTTPAPMGPRPMQPMLRSQQPVPGGQPMQAARMQQGGMRPDMFGVGPESLVATKMAAEHWRSSWVDRQRAEAGPAYGVARGQASVAEPLEAMQNSFIRMRALILPKNAEKQKNPMGLGFWVTIVMMICLIGGLGAYVVYTYLPGAPLQAQVNVAPSAPTPTLTLANNTTPAVIAGKTIKVQGNYFGSNDDITFILNSTQLTSKVQSASSGGFTTTLSIPATTPAGAYALEAQDNHSGQHAFLDIQVLAPNAQSTTNSAIVTTVQGTALKALTFTATPGKGNPERQTIMLKNLSGAPARWTISAITSDGINWLLVQDHTTGGLLNMDATVTIDIGVLTTNLPSGSYTGQVVFTIASQGQVILPVTLTIGNGVANLVVTPDPVMASWQSGGSCQQASITLIDTSNIPVSWEVKETTMNDQQHIKLDSGKIDETGRLDPTGAAGNTTILQITCNGVNLNDVYHVTVYYGNTSQVIPINIGS